MTDVLTGVLNRRGWALALDREERRCRRHGLDAVVAVVDLDGLKAVNDADGHAAGDRRLVECAEAIASAVRAEDTVARLGGDEFAVLAVQIVDGADGSLSPRLIEAFRQMGVQATVGCARRSEHDGLQPAVEAADRDLLAAKARSELSR